MINRFISKLLGYYNEMQKGGQHCEEFYQQVKVKKCLCLAR